MRLPPGHGRVRPKVSRAGRREAPLQRTIALPPGPRGNEHQFSGEPRLRPDGKSVYIHTFNCVLDMESAEPRITFVQNWTRWIDRQTAGS